ncbi:MAG: hypothetical protein J5I53_00465, partial [Bradyrhizobiaceae bacterium]|nr:hypothetical protein [Bradyrhizobiaceae bacterium]
KLQVPALSGPLTLNLPTSSGTLITTANGWALGGNDLTGAGPSENRIGSTSAHDVLLVANGDPKLSISNAATGPVTLLDGTGLSLQESGGSNVSTFTAGTQAADINYTLPTTQPAANDVLTATAVSGSGPYDVTLGWAAGGGSSSSTGTLASDFTISETTTETDITGVTVSLDANSTYEIDAVVVFELTAGNEDLRNILRGPAGAFSWMRIVDASSSTGSSLSIEDNINRTDGDGSGTYAIHGFIRTFATSGNLKLTGRLVSNGGGTDTWTIKAGTFIKVKKF